MIKRKLIKKYKDTYINIFYYLMLDILR